jgi:SPOR domain
MADNNRRPYQTRDMGAQRSSEAPARPPTDDPLAELARLIGQKGPINDPGRNARNNDERYNPARDLARELAIAMRTSRSAQPEPNVGGSRDDNPGSTGNRPYRDTAEPGTFPSRSAEGRHEADSGNRTGNRYEDEGRYEDDGRYEENTRYEDDARYEENARYENSRYQADDRNSEDDGYATDNRYRNDQTEHDSGRQDGHYDYNEDGQDYSDDEAYADDEGYAAGEYEDDASGGRKRGGFIFVATIFGLAVLGTAGAFGYRAMFGGSIAPSLPPIIKAEDGPNKIIPAADAQSGQSRQADATNNDSNEKLVSREEQPVNIQASPSTTPRMVSTVPVFPDSVPGVGPGSAAAGYPIGAMASGGPAFAGSPNSAASTPTGSVPTPAPAADRGATANQPRPVAPMAAAPAPAAPATKKIHTVAIRTDQSDAQDATSSATPRAPKTSSTADANAPLSIVPTGGETAAPAAPAVRPRSAPAHPAPINTAAAATNDAPAPAPTGGGYAVQVSSQHSEAEVQDSFRTLQAKYPDVLGGKQPIIRRADLGAKGIYYRALVGPFASAEEAASMCSSLKAAGGSCLVQKN